MNNDKGSGGELINFSSPEQKGGGGSLLEGGGRGLN